MDNIGKQYPKEFRDDVVRVTRSSDTHFGQLAKDFGVSQAETLARIIRESEPNSEAVTDANNYRMQRKP
ncbi:MAG: transposase-like protein [Candidatus Aldehydirespiratoraceae bacterium]|jgi:transposase-like protein